MLWQKHQNKLNQQVIGKLLVEPELVDFPLYRVEDVLTEYLHHPGPANYDDRETECGDRDTKFLVHRLEKRGPGV